jgi:hypothetical protein
MITELHQASPTLLRLLRAQPELTPGSRAGIVRVLAPMEDWLREQLAGRPDRSEPDADLFIQHILGEALADIVSGAGRVGTEQLSLLRGDDGYARYRREVFDAPRRRLGDARKDAPAHTKHLPEEEAAYHPREVHYRGRAVSLPSPVVTIMAETEWEEEKRVEHYWQQQYRRLLETTGTGDNQPREAIMWGLARRIRFDWDSRNNEHVKAQAELRRRAEDRGLAPTKANTDPILRELTLAGMIQAIGERHRGQHIRFGAEWETDEQGKKRQVIPDELAWHDADDWLATETRKAVIANLVGKNYPGGEDLSSRPCRPLPKTYPKQPRTDGRRPRSRRRAAHVPLAVEHSTGERLDDSPYADPLAVLLARAERASETAQLQALDTALQGVDDEAREITLRYYAGATARELAHQYGRSPKAIAKLAERTRDRLRRQITEMAGPPE